MLRDVVRRAMPYLYWNHLFVAAPAESLPQIPLKQTYRIIFPCDIEGLSAEAFHDVLIDRNLVEARIKAGDLVGLIFCGERIVHRTLVQTQGMARMEGDTRAFYLRRGEKYIHSCQTAHAHRGQGLYPAMLNKVAWACAEMQQSGLLFIACRRENSPSIKGIQRAGFLYSRSSRVCGFLGGKIRLRLWYRDPKMTISLLASGHESVTNIPTFPE